MFEFHKFVDQSINFQESELAKILLYLFISGNREETLRDFICSKLDSSLAQHFPDLFAIPESRGNRSHTSLNPRRSNKGLESNRFDISITDHSGNKSDIVEFKYNRHNYYTAGTKSNLENEVKKDINTLRDHSHLHPEARFWVGLFLVSMFKESGDYPEGYARYLKYEPKRSRLSIFDEQDLYNECDLNLEQIERFILDKKYASDFAIKNVIKKNLASGRHRGFVVRGDLLLFEVNFS